MDIKKLTLLERNIKMGKNIEIHPFVVIKNGAIIEDGAEILPFTYIGKIPGSKILYRKPIFKKKVVIGKRCRIGPSVTIYYDVEIGEDSLVCEGASIREGCRIGRRCIIGRNVTINYNVKVGDDVRIMDGTHITGNTYIGKNVFISVLVSSTNDRSIGFLAGTKKMQGQHIDDDVKIGAGANLLPGIRIGTHSIVAAGAVVRKDVPPNTIVAGNPAKIIGNSERLINLWKARNG